MITVSIPAHTNYSITVGNVSGYVTPSSQSYYSSFLGEVNAEFNYASNIGFYIADLKKNLYTADTWQTAISLDKVSVNDGLGIVVFISTQQFIVNPYIQTCQFGPDSKRYDDVTNPPKYDVNSITNDFSGKSNTNTWTSVYSGNYAANIAKSFKFPDNIANGYIPAAGQANIIVNNKNIFTSLNNLFTSQLKSDYTYWTSTNCGYIGDWGSVIIGNFSFNGFYRAIISSTLYLLVIRDWND